MSCARWEHFEHVGDIGVRGVGATLGEAFEQAALALIAVITEPAGVRGETPVDLHCEAVTPDLLLLDWLNSLIYEMAVRRMLFSRFEVQTDAATLQAKAWGEAVDRARHELAVEVKAASFCELRVTRDAGDCWVAQCVVDV